VSYDLWKWCGTVYGNGVAPFMEMVWHRLWKWCGTVYGNGVAPFMEMVGNSFMQPK
jgi:hypothetical protein